jgi:hypothetical protein
VTVTTYEPRPCLQAYKFLSPGPFIRLTQDSCMKDIMPRHICNCNLQAIEHFISLCCHAMLAGYECEALGSKLLHPGWCCSPLLLLIVHLALERQWLCTIIRDAYYRSRLHEPAGQEARACFELDYNNLWARHAGKEARGASSSLGVHPLVEDHDLYMADQQSTINAPECCNCMEA